MSSWSASEINEALGIIYAKAAKDEAFRKMALNNPAKAIEEVSGKAIPDNVKIRFFEPGDAHLAYILPPFKNTDELSADDLESVTGGVLIPDKGDMYRCSKCNTFFEHLPGGYHCPSCGEQFYTNVR